jgi:hypothetical protein
MDTKLFCFVMLALLVNLGEAANIFVINKVPVLSTADVEHLLAREYPSQRNVARILARAKSKNALINGVSFERLLELNSYDLSRDCKESEITGRDAICQKQLGSVKRYCEHCVTTLKDACTESPASVVRSNADTQTLQDFRVLVEGYIEKTGLGSGYPADMYVVDFRHDGLNKQSRQEYEPFCAKSITGLDKAMRFFDLEGDKSRYSLGKEDRELANAVDYCRFLNMDPKKSHVHAS